MDAERNYPIEQYSLATLSDVEHFWHRLWEVCSLYLVFSIFML